NSRHEQQPVTLRTVAEHVGLAPCSVSAILNNSAAGMSIPQQTKDRVWRAARRLNYQPNYSARALRTRRTYTVAILMPDIGYAPAARIAAGAEDFLRENDYCMIIATYDQSSEWQQNQFTQLRQRGVEGVILLQAELALSAGFPVTTVHAVPAQASPMTAAAREKLTIVGRKAATQLVHEIEEAGGRLGGSPYAGVLTGEDTLTLRQAPTERRL
ncbi:MAG TPA: LacI family DNA-binding transcriptional regulator, partial [Terriglobales bacterium]|nr:LacI family DNA-binding transcriptional regulator [Terriglobales bacterium]